MLRYFLYSTPIASLIFLLSLGGCSLESKQTPTPALFDTKLEAEKAAPSFGCVGAHQMGNKWMPCKKHTSHESHHNH